MGMPEDVTVLMQVLQDYLDLKAPMPKAFVFAAITECRHENPDHDDYEHVLANAEYPEAKADFDKLVDYLITTADDYQETIN